MARLPRIGVTLGDPCGIGPEVAARALAGGVGGCVPVVYGQRAVWGRALGVVGLSDPLEKSGEWVECDDANLAALPYGAPCARGGLASLRALERATADLVAGRLDGLCTAPLSKAAVQHHEPGFVGHTEYLQQAFGVPRVVMLMASPRLRVALATTHVAIADVPRRLSVDGLCETVRIVAAELGRRFGVAAPRIGLCGLNPHAGEGGSFGDEEARVISPAMALLEAEGLRVEGPFAADGLFPRVASAGLDVVVAMYHDQGLVPFKMLAFHEGVNVTCGLPRPRTSPDHGTAYDLAGTGRADPRSMASALALCVELAERAAAQGGPGS
jgi:4-hydroxythreonine-4-phosphate dehydrogenase